MELNMTAMFEQAKIGMVVFTLYEGRQLKSNGKLSNYVTIGMGPKYEKRSTSIKDPKNNPWFKEEKIILWASTSNWVDDVSLKVFDEDGGNNILIGQASFSLLPYMRLQPEKFSPQVFPIRKGTGNEAEHTGEIVLKVNEQEEEEEES